MHGRWLRLTRQRLPVRPLISSNRDDLAGAASLVRPARRFHSCGSLLQDDHTPLRKQLKDAAKAARTGVASPTLTESPDILRDWELTVGIEIHAQLNASRKLFSREHYLYPGSS